MNEKAAAPEAGIAIEVVYAEPGKQLLLACRVPAGSTVAEALVASGIAEHFPQVEFAKVELGVWGQTVTRSRLLVEGDRLEIYRPLLMDPREARRQLATHGRAMGQKGINRD